METVTHREMRNRSGEILRRVAAGESVQVSNNGRPTAMIVPVGGSELDGLIERGEARPARTGLEALLSIKRVVSPMTSGPMTSGELTSGELVDDSRGRW